MPRSSKWSPGFPTKMLYNFLIYIYIYIYTHTHTHTHHACYMSCPIHLPCIFQESTQVKLQYKCYSLLLLLPWHH
jgi:hypothetical protein